MSSVKNNNYEGSLYGLAKHYGHFFGDSDSEFGAEVWNHIFDPNTREILLVQPKRDKNILDQLGDWHGHTCYEYLEGRDTPCPDCPVNKISRDNFFVYTRSNPRSGRKFFTESILIDYEGKPAVLEKVIDITDPDYRDLVMNEYIAVKNLSSSVLSILMDETNILENFERVCQEIGTFYNADRALITEYCLGKLNTTWSRLPQPFTQVCTELSDEAIAGLTKATEGLSYIWVPDVMNATKLDMNLREYWFSRGIESILLVPMSYNGSFIGTVSLHNIRERFNEIDILRLLSLAVAKCIYSYVVESKAERQLYTDPLTGALNLSGLKLRSFDLFREYPDNKYYFCVMDIRYFGGLNRRYGFELGDKILIETARHLDKYLDKDEAFCRISSDVFCFLAKYPGEEAVRSRFARFAESMQCFETLSAANHSIEFQCGAYVLNGDRNIAQAIDKANLARISLRNEPGSNVAFFSNELFDKSKHETELLQDFKPALAQGELTVYYQPQCNYSSNKIVGAEALVRWKSPKHGNVSPADFIPLLERHGLIYDLDKYVWEEVCRRQQRWISIGHECPVSVNVSRHDVLRNDICEDLCALLDKYNIPKRLFPLEITETAYIKNSDELIDIVDKLKAAGFTVEMDDFGSGYSSLNVLKDVSVDVLKLDMKFLDMGDKKGKGSSILNCVVRMTRWLGLDVLAEGVETKEQAEYLKNIGCDLMQGYYFAHPMPAEDFESMLMADSVNPADSGEADIMQPDQFMESLMSNPLLFNSLGATAIVEYNNDAAEVLMVNDGFLEMVDLTRENYLPHMKNLRKYAESILDDPGILAAPTDPSKKTRTRVCNLKYRDNTTRKVRIFSRTLLEGKDRCILLIGIDDLSDAESDS